MDKLLKFKLSQSAHRRCLDKYRRYQNTNDKRAAKYDYHRCVLSNQRVSGEILSKKEKKDIYQMCLKNR